MVRVKKLIGSRIEFGFSDILIRIRGELVKERIMAAPLPL